jgi:phosphoribosylanthranilate isomerase
MRTRVKICGFTRVETAVYAAHLGVDAIGLVFYPPSPRHVSVQQALKITQALPAFTSVVALFVDETEANIRQILCQIPIDYLQFHGNEPPEACRLYQKPYIKAISMSQKTADINTLATQYQDASALLLDAYHLQGKGGMGECFDWSLIPKQCALPIILAGGLTPENAPQAIKCVNPYALDVSSGVEITQGLKSNNKMAAFIQAVNSKDLL